MQTHPQPQANSSQPTKILQNLVELAGMNEQELHGRKRPKFNQRPITVRRYLEGSSARIFAMVALACAAKAGSNFAAWVRLPMASERTPSK